MSAFNIVTWNETTKTTKRQVSNTNTFDFQAVRIGADTLTISQSGSGGSAKFDFGSRILGGALSPLISTDLANKGYTDAAIAAAVVSGGTVKEAVLSDHQLSSTVGISAAAIFYLTAVAGSGDTFIITDGTNTETWTYGAVSSAFTPAVGITAANSMSDLASRINTDSVYWSADWVPSTFAEINASGSIIIYEKTTAAGASTSRFYGVFASPTTAKIMPFNTLSEYNVTAALALVTNLTATDPAAGRFGFRRTLGSLVGGEIHYSQETDILYSWNASSATWNTLASGVLPDATSAPGGGVKGKLTVDSNKGLSVVAGVLGIVTDGQGLGFSAGNLVLSLDGGTLSKSGSGIKVAAAGITATELATSVAGNGLTGGAGTALAVVAADGISVGAGGVSVNYSDTLVNDNAGTISAGQIVYETTSGHVDLANATISGLYTKNVLIVKAATIATTASGLVYVRMGAEVGGYSGLTPGPVFVDKTTPGAVTQTVSSYTTGDTVYQVGRAISTTTIVYDPKPVIEL